MEFATRSRLQLLLLSNDPAHMKTITVMLHAHGIQTVTEPPSLPWRSAGFDSLVMVSTENYPKASALYLDLELAVAFTGIVYIASTAVNDTTQHGVVR
jgi:hypothetical protein